MAGPWVAASLLAAVLVVAAPVQSSSPAEPSLQELGRQPGDGEQCLVCGQPIEGETSVEVRYKGRVFHVKESMLGELRADPDAYFRKLQARSGLFDEAAVEGPPMHRGWLYAGVYVAVGLLFGALCASLALGRGRRPLPWLFAGLAANVVALAALLALALASTRDGGHDGAEGRSGPLGPLGRVTTTRAPRQCPTCGAPNHPAAAVCSSCGAALDPLVRPETELADLGGAS